MARLIRIGNSHGVRIPKSLVRQAGLEGRKLEITAGEDGVWIRPLRHRREGWEQALAELGQTGNDEDLLPIWMQAPLTKPNGIGRSPRQWGKVQSGYVRGSVCRAETDARVIATP